MNDTHDGSLKPGKLMTFQADFKNLKPLHTEDIQEFTPLVLSGLRVKLSNLAGPNHHIATLFLGAQTWCEMAVTPKWGDYLDPTTRQDVLLTGRVAHVMGMEVWTDAYVHPLDRFIPSQEIWLILPNDGFPISVKANLQLQSEGQS